MAQPDPPIEKLTLEIASRSDFVQFIHALLDNLEQHPEVWENRDLRSYMDALAAFLNDAEGYYRNAKLGVSADTPSWRLFADSLLAARVYE